MTDEGEALSPSYINGIYNAGRAKETLGRELTSAEWELLLAGFTPATLRLHG